MREMRKRGDHYYQIADDLNAEGVPCRMAHNGKIWKANTIQKMLAREGKAQKKLDTYNSVCDYLNQKERRK
jgi:hypothetical protein